MTRKPTALGQLEIAVLDRLWKIGRSDVSRMHTDVGAPRGLVRNTIQSTLERLVKKGLAERTKVGRAYAYHPRITKAEYLREALSELTDRVPGIDGALLISTFVDFAERTGSETLEELETRVRKRRRELEGKA